MVLTGLLLLLQSFPLGLAVFGLVLVIIAGILRVVCELDRSSSRERQRRREQSERHYEAPRWMNEPSRRESGRETAETFSDFSGATGHTDWKAPDVPSSPVGGTCLACGATITEETFTTCPDCGTERQRCPVCQRYIAGGQDLLACIHCRAPGHANEMRLWVEQHGTCPYCARRIDKDQLRHPAVRRRVRRR
jgi:hypothetical protein